MMPSREWLRPPRSLLAILFLVTCVSVTALGWFGWKLLDQERVVESQRARERLEQQADRIAAIARGTLAETGERLGTWLLAPPPDGKPEEGLLLVISAGGLTATPSRRLLYHPTPPAEPDDLSNVFADGEVFEFQQALPDRALEFYRRAAESRNPDVKAGALLRIARVSLKTGHRDEARGAYLKLANTDGSVAGVPAELVARQALCELSGTKADAEALRQDLLSARWPLSRGQFRYYLSEASRLSGPNDYQMASSDAAALSEAVAQGWSEVSREPGPRGQTTIWVDKQPYFLIWRGVPSHRAVLVTKPESLLKPILSDGDVRSAAVDSDGRVVAGRRNGAGHAAVLTPAETQLPWTLYLTGAQGFNEPGMLVRQRFLLLITALMVLFLIGGAWFIARAIQGDLAVARMQSDFVSAVSHEFRSPLTSIRQLSEILALGRIPNEARRHVYYETLVRETIRLQRLVEALLNFGRMEAGVRQYRFEPLDAAGLVSRVATEFEAQIAGSGRHIETHMESSGAEARCMIDADPEALSVALRNLVDNALKYGPDCPTVWVNCGIEKSRVAIRVRDSGPGIPASEKRVIFRKFVRGSAAEAANVKGSGVGLAMVRHIVAAHGGDVTLASEPGSGSVFTILLPRGGARA